MITDHLMITNHSTIQSRSPISRGLRSYRFQPLMSRILATRACVLLCALSFTLSHTSLCALPPFPIQEVFAQESPQESPQKPLQKSSQGRALTPPRLTTRFNARVVEWDPQAQALKARDQVRLIQGELSVTCASAMVEFRGAEHKSTGQVSQQIAQPTSLEALALKRIRANGQVRVRFRDLHLSASAIDYDHINETLEVTGPIVGRWGQARLRGTHLTLSLATQTARAEQVEVSIPLPQFVPQRVREKVRDLNSKRSINVWRSR